MPRSRSRSPRRERRHSRERRRRRKSRSRSRSPRRRSRDRHRSRSPASSYRHRERKSREHVPERQKLQEFDQYHTKPPVVEYLSDHEVYEIEDDDDDVVVEPQENSFVKSEAAMMKAMGFVSFDSTKGKKVAGNDIYVANTARKRRYRQYMNRRGGFNRPLDFIA
ncbi:U4/U6.U5 small nuclear ribonucleoprotein 27 kDa protein-like [Ylistrum balloti]|uniref:U4/U6.U5 small nuclear ribonucleoprotein 27 kDa protein-like n=1 Tax=Ylistrum balloti TaxID=509963 RepID=UPI002905BF55|nr:U4/U6.U5 small nuclear ribonucleoprotein 27 kDa protein-like [Ylistrum balloti]